MIMRMSCGKRITVCDIKSDEIEDFRLGVRAQLPSAFAKGSPFSSYPGVFSTFDDQTLGTLLNGLSDYTYYFTAPEADRNGI